MPDSNVRSDAVNVEHVMDQVRARIREKRGVNDTEEQIQELANVKLEKILDPRGIRSDLLQEFQKMQSGPPGEVSEDAIRASPLFESQSGAVRFIRRLLRPILGLFFNPAPVVQVLKTGVHDQLFVELIRNLLVENTRLGVAVKNLTMTVASLTGRLEFNERRARALESVVVYKPSDEPVPPPPARPPQARNEYRPPSPPSAGLPTGGQGQAPAAAASGGQNLTAGDRGPQPATGPSGQGEGPGQRSRRRRRRRGRRGGGLPGGQSPQAPQAASDAGPTDGPAGPLPTAPDSHDESGGHEPDSQ